MLGIKFSLRKFDIRSWVACTNELSEVFRNAKTVNINTFTGKHPAGNIGVQIHHIKPINSRDDIVWYLDVQTVADIGNYLLSGR